MKPYIGVTGFVNQSEIFECLKEVPDNTERLFMAGVLLSNKTINGGTNKYPVRYPHYNQISKIFVNDVRCLNMIHYTTDKKETLVSQLLDAAEIGGSNCYGFQLNIVWPNIEHLQEVKRELPNHKIVIQCSGGAMRVFQDAPAEEVPQLLYNQIALYKDAGVIDYMLIDPSGGKGKSFDVDTALSLLKLHIDAPYGIGVAGGLSADTLVRLLPVVTHVPNLFWDAEGGLRDEQDHFILEKAKKYIKYSYYIDNMLSLVNKEGKK